MRWALIKDTGQKADGEAVVICVGAECEDNGMEAIVSRIFPLD